MDFDPALESICWYPSSYLDFRHIAFFEHQKLCYRECNGITQPPRIYFMSDMIIEKNRRHGQQERPDGCDMPFLVGQELSNNSASGGHDWPSGTGMLKVTEVVPLELASDIWNPCEYLYQFEEKRKTKAWFLRLAYENTIYRNGAKIRLETKPCVIYFPFENLNLFADFILTNAIRISHLVHINDGGASFGGSRFKMKFIYEFYNEIGLCQILSDMTPSTKDCPECRNIPSGWHERSRRILDYSNERFGYNYERFYFDLIASHGTRKARLRNYIRRRGPVQERVEDFFLPVYHNNPMPLLFADQVTQECRCYLPRPLCGGLFVRKGTRFCPSQETCWRDTLRPESRSARRTQ